MSRARAWALSLILHVLLLAGALGVGQLVPEPPRPLRWEVSLIGAPAPTGAVETDAAPIRPPAAAPARRPAREAPRVAGKPSPPARSTPPAPPVSPDPIADRATAIVPTGQTSPTADLMPDAPAGSAAVAAAAEASPGGGASAATVASLSAAPLSAAPPLAQERPAPAPERLWLAALQERMRERRRYPALARRLGQEGVVAVEIIVEADGSLKELGLLRPSGYPALDRAAQELVRQAVDDMRNRIRPERGIRLEVPVAYRLQN